MLALCTEVEVDPGERLLAAGALPTGLHLLLEGHVAVTVRTPSGSHEVALLGPGSWVGELSLLDGGLPVADVTAETPVRALRVAPADGPALLEVDAVHLQLATVAQRRRATNRAIAVSAVRTTTREGEPLLLRPLWPDDWRLLAGSLDRVSDDSLRKRFFQLPKLTEARLRRLASVDHRLQFAWAAFAAGRPAGVARYGLEPEDRATAEIALLVTDDLHGHGIGGRLVAALAATAHVHGAHHLAALARADNHGVHRLLTGFGASWQVVGDGSVEARWPVAEALAHPRHRQVVAAVTPVARAVLGEVAEP